MRCVQGREIHIAPDCFDGTWEGIPFRTLLTWALEPASEDVMWKLLQKGRADAAAWAQLTGLAEAAAPDPDDLYRYKLLQSTLAVVPPDMTPHFEQRGPPDVPDADLKVD